MTTQPADPPRPPHRPAIGSEQGQLTRDPIFAVGDSVILQSTGEVGKIVSDADDLGYRVKVEFGDRKILRYAKGNRLRGLPMHCDVCDYEDRSQMGNVVQIDPDGVRRCKRCRHIIRYGRYVPNDDEQFELDQAGDYTDEWKAVLENGSTNGNRRHK